MKLSSWLDFPTIMVLLVALSGVIWAFDAAVLARRRRLARANLGDKVDGELAAKVMQPRSARRRCISASGVMG